MELREYWRLLRRRVWIPALLMAVTGLTAGILTFVAKPEYTATATVMARGQQSGAKTVSFPEAATSNSLALRVSRQAGLHESADRLTSRIKVSSGRSNLYKLSVSDRDPQVATSLANTVAKEAAALYQELAAGTKASVVRDLEKDGAGFRDQYVAATRALLEFNSQHPDVVGAETRSRDVNVGTQALELQLDQRAASDAYLHFQQEVTRARVDELSNARNFSASVVDEAAAKPDTRGRLLKIIYAAALALVLGGGIVIALEYLDNAVREPEEAEQLVGAPVVGIIPRTSARTLKPAAGGAL